MRLGMAQGGVGRLNSVVTSKIAVRNTLNQLVSPFSPNNPSSTGTQSFFIEVKLTISSLSAVPSC